MVTAKVGEAEAMNVLEGTELRLATVTGERDRLREGDRRAMNELGVPGPGYPQNVANAYSILHGDCAQKEAEHPLNCACSECRGLGNPPNLKIPQKEAGDE
jgi:hypothetical protein